MSRLYQMSVAIRGFDPDRREAIQAAGSDEWPFEEWFHDDPATNPAVDVNRLTASGESSLCGGETEDEFARRFARAVWEANGGFCEVEVDATYLENLPCENYSFDEEAYEDLMGKKEGAMADRMAAEIWIGGRLPRGLLEEFPISDLRLDWDATPFDSSTEQGILAARDENGLLHFADDEIAWGEFTELENWLREHAMPFERWSAGKYEYDPCFRAFRPDLPGKPDRYTLTTQAGETVLYRKDVETVLQGMARLVNVPKRPAAARLRAWERLYRKLLRLVPPTLPALPPLEIVDRKAKRTARRKQPEPPRPVKKVPAVRTSGKAMMRLHGRQAKGR